MIKTKIKMQMGFLGICFRTFWQNDFMKNLYLLSNFPKWEFVKNT